MADHDISEEDAPNAVTDSINLQYPLNNEGYKGRVTFKVVKIDPITAESIVTEANRVVDQVGDQVPQEAIDQNKGKQPSTQTIEDESKNKTFLGSVTLYLPAALSISDGVGYANTPLGTLGGAAAAGLEQGGVSGAVKEVAKGIGSFASALNNLNLDGPLSRLAVTRTAQTFLPTEIAAAVQLKTRVAINPNTRATFESVGVREIPFTFKMVAKSADEAVAIENIIKFFRKNLYPGALSEVGESGYILGYELPNPFEIRVTYDGKRVATQFVDAYLKTVQTVYNQQSMGMHSDGHFTDVEVSLSFVESRTLTAEDIDRGY